MADDFDPDAYLKDFNPDAYLKSGPQTSEAPTSGGFWQQAGRVAKQVPLGAARGFMGMAEMMAPAAVGEALAVNPRLYEEMEKQGGLPTQEDYHKEGQRMLGSVNSPENLPQGLYENMASGAGEAIGPSMMMGPIGLGPNLAIGMAGGASGKLAEHLTEDESQKPVAGIVGNLIGSLGLAGAMGVARGILNYANPVQRRLPGQFDLPTTKGVLENDPAQIGREQAMAAGAKGMGAQSIMRDQQVQREAEIAAGQRRVGAGLGPEATPVEAGADTSQALRSRANELQSEGDKLYKSAASKNPWTVADEFRPTTHIDDALTAKGYSINERNTPMAQEAYDRIADIERREAARAAREGNEGNFLLSLKEIQEAHSEIMRMRADPRMHRDATVLKHIKDSFKEWRSDVFDNALFHGDKTAIDDIKKAEPIWRRYRQMTDADPKKDYTRIISKIVGSDHTPEEVANWALNVTSLGDAARASRFTRYMKGAFGTNSEEVGSLRSALWHKVTHGADEAAPLPYNKMASNIENMVKGRGAPLARELYNDSERATMLEFARALRKTNPALENPPKTAWVGSKLLWPTLYGLSGLAGAERVYHTGDWRWVALTGMPLIREGHNMRKALDAISVRRQQAPTTLPAIGVGAAVQSRKSQEKEP